MSSLAEAIKKRQKEAEDMEMLEKLGAAMDKVKPPRVQPRVQRTPKKKQTISGYHRPYGRQQYLWNAMKEVMTKQAKKIVKKVTREDVV